jgi:hypothetical protein
MEFTIESTAFGPGGEIPVRYTCDGEDISPPLAWRGVPEGTRSLALVVDDPDAPDPAAPRMVWVHWVVSDLPPALGGLREGTSGRLPSPAVEGWNDGKERGRRGPCPPIGRHRCYHKLYALDRTLEPGGPLTKAELERRMVGHVLAKAELVGRFQRERQPR